MDDQSSSAAERPAEHLKESPWVTRGLLLFGLVSVATWALSTVRPTFQWSGIYVGRWNFYTYWSLALIATWWSTASLRLGWVQRLLTRLSSLVALAGIMVLPKVMHELPGAGAGYLIQAAPPLLWATLFSAALARITPSIFFARAWWLLITYRLFFHALSAAHAQEWADLSGVLPLLSWSAKVSMLLLLAYSWLALTSPEEA